MLVNRLGGFVTPMLMIFLTTHKGLSLLEAGVTVSMYGIGALVGNALGGVLSDRIGRRTTLLTSLGTSASSMLLVSIAGPSSLSLGASVALLGLTSAMYQPTASAIIVDLVEPQYRTKAFGYYYWAANLGFSLAVLVAGFLAETHFSLLFVLDALTTLIFAAIVAWGVPETQPKAAEHLPGSFLTPFFDRRFAPFLALAYVGAFILMQRAIMLPVDMTSKHLATSDFGMAIAVNALLVVAIQPSVARLVMRGARSTWLAIASVVLGVGFGLTWLADTLALYALTVGVWTVAELIFAPINPTIVSDFAPPHLRGRYQGAFSLTWSLAMMTAPVIAPMVVEASSLRTFWLLCLVLGATSGLAYLLFVKPSGATAQ